MHLRVHVTASDVGLQHVHRHTHLQHEADQALGALGELLAIEGGRALHGQHAARGAQERSGISPSLVQDRYTMAAWRCASPRPAPSQNAQQRRLP